MVIIFVGAVVGLLQGVIIILLNSGMGKIKIVCSQVTALQREMTDKVGSTAHEKVEIKLGKFGDRILKLEMILKVKEEPE
jgi:hypothetical protein